MYEDKLDRIIFLLEGIRASLEVAQGIRLPEERVSMKDYLELARRIGGWSVPIQRTSGPAHIFDRQARVLIEACPVRPLACHVDEARLRRYLFLVPGHRKTLVLARGHTGFYISLVSNYGKLMSRMKFEKSLISADDAFDWVFGFGPG